MRTLDSDPHTVGRALARSAGPASGRPAVPSPATPAPPEPPRPATPSPAPLIPFVEVSPLVYIGWYTYCLSTSDSPVGSGVESCELGVESCELGVEVWLEDEAPPREGKSLSYAVAEPLITSCTGIPQRSCSYATFARWRKSAKTAGVIAAVQFWNLG